MGKIRKTGLSNTNTWRYEPLKTRISKLKITSKQISFHTVNDQNEVGQDENEAFGFSFFKKALEYWGNLNRTADFKDLRKELKFKADDITNVVFYKKDIINLLLERLNCKDFQAYAPILDLIVNLVRDLEEDIDDDFFKLLSAIFVPLKLNTPEMAEIVFTTFARLVKILPQKLVGDAYSLFETTKEHLIKGPNFVRRFTSEALGYLLRRKMKYDFMQLYTQITLECQNMITSTNLSQVRAVESLSLLFFEIFKQSGNALSSLCLERLSLLFDLDKLKASSDCEIDSIISSRVISGFMSLLAQYCNQEAFNSILSFLLQTSFNILDFIEEKTSNKEECSKIVLLIDRLLNSLQIFVNLCKDSKWLEMYTNQLCSIVNRFLKNESYLLPSESIKLIVLYTNSILTKIPTNHISIDLILNPIEKNFEINNIIPFYTTLFESLKMLEIDSKHSCILKTLEKFVQILWSKNMTQLSIFLLRTSKNQFNLVHQLPRSLSMDIYSYAEKFVYEEEINLLNSDNFKNYSLPVLIIFILSQDAYDKCKIYDLCNTFMNKLFELMLKTNDKSIKFALVCYLSVLIKSVSNIPSNSTTNECLNRLLFEKIFYYCVSYKPFLQAITSYLNENRNIEALNVALVEKCYFQLIKNTCSFDRETRIYSLKIISALNKLLPSSKPSDTMLINMCIEYETIAICPTKINEKSLMLNKITALLESSDASGNVYDILTSVGMAQMSVKLSPLWPLADLFLFKMAKKSERSFYDTLEYMLRECISKYDEHNSTIKTEDLLSINTFSEADAKKITKSHTDFGLKLHILHFKTLYMMKICDIAYKKVNVLDSTTLLYSSILTMFCVTEVPKVNYINCFQLLLKTFSYVPDVFSKKFSFLSSSFLLGINSCKELPKLKKSKNDIKIPLLSQCLLNFMQLFSSMQYSSKLDINKQLFDQYIIMIKKPDNLLQIEALKCIFTYNLNIPTSITNLLHSLCEEKQFKKTISSINVELDLKKYFFNANNDSNFIVMDLLVNILYGKLIHRCSKRNSSKINARRGLILNFFTYLDDYCISSLLRLVLEPFNNINPFNTIEPFDLVDLNEVKGDLMEIMPRGKVIVKLLMLLEKVINIIRTRLSFISGALYKTLIYTLTFLKKGVFTDPLKKKLENKSLACLTNLFLYNIGNDNDIFIKPIFRNYLDDSICNALHKKNVLKLLIVWTQNEKYISQMHQEFELVPKLARTLGQKDIKPSIAEKILTILDRLLSKNIPLDIVTSKCAEDLIVNVESLIKNSISKKSNNISKKSNSISKKSNSMSIVKSQTQTILISALNVAGKLFTLSKDTSVVFSRATSIIIPLLKLSNKTISSNIKKTILETISSNVHLIDQFKLIPNTESVNREGFKLVSNMEPVNKEDFKHVPNTESINREDFKLVLNTESANEDGFKLAHNTMSVNKDGFKYYCIISKLLCDSSNDVAKEVVKFFTALSHNSWDFLVPVVDLLTMLISDSFSPCDNKYYDNLFTAYTTLKNEYVNIFTPLQWLPILNIIFRDIKSDTEFSIRTSAIDLLKKLVSFVSTLENKEEYVSLIEDVVFVEICKLIKDTSEKKRISGINILGHIVLNIKNSKVFSGLSYLIFDPNEPETNFFKNVCHLQIHRRSRALIKLESVFKQEKVELLFSARLIGSVLLQIPLGFIKDENVTSNEYSTLIDQSIRTLSAIVPKLSQSRFISTLKEIIRLYEKNPNRRKLMTKLMSNIILAFFTYHSTQNSDMNNSISQIYKEILPKLEKILYSDNEKNLSDKLFVSYPIAQIIKIFDNELVENNRKWRKLTFFLSKNLCSKSSVNREAVRDSMVNVIKIMGVEKIGSFIENMKSVLLDGYQLSVMGYSVNYLVIRAFSEINSFNNEDVIKSIVEICIKEIFENVKEEKEEAGSYRSMIETASTKSYNTIEYLSRVIINITSVYLFIDPIKKRMFEVHDSKHSNKIANYLRHLSIGISKNINIPIKDKIEFISNTLGESLPFVNAKYYSSDITPGNKLEIIKSIPKENSDIYKTNIYLLVDFCLTFLLSLIKCGVSGGDSLIEHVVYAHHSISPSTVVAASKILDHLVNVEVQIVDRFMLIIIKRIMSIISQYNIGELVVQLSFKLLATILRGRHLEKISQTQIISLLNLFNSEILAKSDRSKHIFTFLLIRAIIVKKRDLVESSGIMDKILELSINSPIRSIRAECKKCITLFICNPNTSLKLLEKHIMFFIGNLSYKQETGRIAALEIIDDIIEKLSKEVFNDYFEIILLSLVVLIDNEISDRCIEMAKNLIKKILLLCSQIQLDKINTLLNKWICSRKELQLASVHLFSICCECVYDKVSKTAQGICKAACEIFSEKVYKCSDDNKSDVMHFNWRFTYHALRMLCILTTINWKISIQTSCENFWANINTLCLHPHDKIKNNTLEIISNVAKEANSVEDITQLTNILPSTINSLQKLNEIIYCILELLHAHDLSITTTKISARTAFLLSNLRVHLSKSQFDDAFIFNGLETVIDKTSSAKCATFAFDLITYYIDNMSKDVVVNIIDSISNIIYKLNSNNVSSALISENCFSNIPQIVASLQSKLQEKVGTDEYLASYRRVYIKFQEKKNQRRAKNALLAITNPEAHSLKKIKESQRKRLKKKKTNADSSIYPINPTKEVGIVDVYPHKKPKLTV